MKQAILFFCSIAGFLAGCQAVDSSHPYRCLVEGKNGKFGYVDRQGKIVIPIQYEHATQFWNGLAVVSNKDSKDILIKCDGSTFFELPDDYYCDLAYFPSGYLRCYVDVDKVQYLNVETKKFSTYRYGFASRHFSSNRVWVSLDGLDDLTCPDGPQTNKYVLLDSDFRLVSSEVYVDVVGFHGDYGAGRINAADLKDDAPRWKILDKSGKCTTTIAAGSVGISNINGIIFYTDLKTELWGIAKTDGTVIVQPTFITARDFTENLAAVSINLSEKDDSTERYGFIDTGGAFVIKPRFSKAKVFSEGLAYVEEVIDGKRHAGFIDKKANWVIRNDNIEFVACGGFKDGLCTVQLQDGNIVVIDTTGKIQFSSNPEYTIEFYCDELD